MRQALKGFPRKAIWVAPLLQAGEAEPNPPFSF